MSMAYWGLVNELQACLLVVSVTSQKLDWQSGVQIRGAGTFLVKQFKGCAMSE